MREVGDQLGNREPCGADVETSFSFAPALGAQAIPDASACQIDDPPPLAFNRDLEISNLIELAQAGGRPSFEAHDYWEPDKSIIYEFKTGGGSTCIVPVDPPPPDGIDEADLEVLVNGTKVEFVMNCSTEDGWIWINEYDTIEICGEACPLWDDDCHAAPPHVVADVKVRWTCP